MKGDNVKNTPEDKKEKQENKKTDEQNDIPLPPIDVPAPIEEPQGQKQKAPIKVPTDEVINEPKKIV